MLSILCFEGSTCLANVVIGTVITFKLSGMEIGFSWMSDLQISEVDISSEDIVICRV